MDIVYTIIAKSEINDDLLIICSYLFNNNYGISQTYNVYRTVNIIGGSLTVWLCT